jgi:hypothetical protein
LALLVNARDPAHDIVITADMLQFIVCSCNDKYGQVQLICPANALENSLHMHVGMPLTQAISIVDRAFARCQYTFGHI